MSSKTFESVKSPLELTVVRTNEDLVRVITQLPDETGRAIDLAPSDAPALALAILEAAGVEPSSPHYGLNDSPEWNVRWASHYLGRSIELTEAKTAEAKEQAELEAEALDLFNLWLAGFNYEGYSEWTGENAELKGVWLAVARKAREMRKS
ncbi:MAG: hypothetical protein ACTH2A_06710 [Glutamicibacter ardleyensis]